MLLIASEYKGGGVIHGADVNWLDPYVDVLVEISGGELCCSVPFWLYSSDENSAEIRDGALGCSEPIWLYPLTDVSGAA